MNCLSLSRRAVRPRARGLKPGTWAAGLICPLLALAAAPGPSPALPSGAAELRQPAGAVQTLHGLGEPSSPASEPGGQRLAAAVSAEAPSSSGLPAVHSPPPAEAPRLRFEPDGLGGFFFDTGVVRGRLHAGGASLGVTEAYHVPTGARLDQSKGLLSHYRVFANGRRFGHGAWDWPSTAHLLPDGRVEVRWADTNDRPFTLRARYQLSRPGILTVETLVEAREELRGFEVFLASYFDPAFTNSFVLAKGRVRDGYVNATLDKGEWQMYPRDSAARALAGDGRWKLEPHPVNWTFPAELASGPTVRAFRRALDKGLLATFSADAADCFAVATPHQTEAHFSTYLSLFGRTLAAGETARARVALIITGPAAPAAQ